MSDAEKFGMSGEEDFDMEQGGFDMDEEEELDLGKKKKKKPQ